MKLNKKRYDYIKQKKMSENITDSDKIRMILIKYFEGSNAVKSNDKEDLSGTDWWIMNVAGRDLSVDIKVRSRDCRDFNSDDLCLEIWSNKEKGIVGWTLRDDKRTDYIMYYWVNTGRWHILSFPMLYKATKRNYKEWIIKFEYKPTENVGKSGNIYRTWCVYVPVVVVMKEIYECSIGVVD